MYNSTICKTDFRVFRGIGGRRVGARRVAPAAAQDPPPGRQGRQRLLAAHGQLGLSRLASRPRKPAWLAALVQLAPRWAGRSRWMTRAAGPPSRPSELGSLAASASSWPARLAQSASLVSTTGGGPGVRGSGPPTGRCMQRAGPQTSACRERTTLRRTKDGQSLPTGRRRR